MATLTRVNRFEFLNSVKLIALDEHNPSQIQVTEERVWSNYLSNISKLEDLLKLMKNPSFCFKLDPVGANFLFNLISAQRLIQQHQYKELLTYPPLERSHRCFNGFPRLLCISDSDEVNKIIIFLRKFAKALFSQRCEFHYCQFGSFDLFSVFQFACYSHVNIVEPTKVDYLLRTQNRTTAFGLLFVNPNVHINEKRYMIRKALELGVDPNLDHLECLNQTPLTFSVLHLENETIEFLLDRGYKIRAIDQKAVEYIQSYLIHREFYGNPFRRYSLYLIGTNSDYRKDLHRKIIKVARVLLRQGLRFTDQFINQTDHIPEYKRSLRQNLSDLQKEANLIVPFKSHLENYLPVPLAKIARDYFF